MRGEVVRGEAVRGEAVRGEAQNPDFNPTLVLVPIHAPRPLLMCWPC